MSSREQTILISGSSGYLGRALCRELIHEPWCGQIVGFDRRRPLDKHPKVSFRELDINDPSLGDWLVELAPDAVVHLAFVLNPIHDEALMHRVNVEGTERLLDGVARAGVRQVLVASSGTAYGAWPDNPEKLREGDRLRANPGFRYAADKGEVEVLCSRFQEEHPEVTLSVIRPCVVFGPTVENYLSRLLTGLPVVVGLRGYEPPLQFVHEDDVVGAILAILEAEASGAFNVAPPDTVSMAETLAAAEKPVLRLPDGLLGPIADKAWRLRLDLLGAPPSFLDYLRYPWVLDSRKLIDELGFSYRYSSRETLEVMLRAKGLIR